MLDMKFIRDNAELVKEAAKKKMIDINIDKILELDAKRLENLKEYELLRAKQNQASETIAKAEGEEKQKLITEMREVSNSVTKFKDQLMEVEQELNDLLLRVPQIPKDGIPVGDESANTVVKTVGEIPKFDFEIKDHMQIAKDLDLVDFERGVKLMGTRGYILKGRGAQLQNALINYALDFLRERDYTELHPPVLALGKFFEGTGHFPFAEEETFKVFDQKDEQKLYLTGTAEIPLCGYHADEVLEKDQLPLKYMAGTNCFRTEVGSYGKDTHGLYRLKQFSKVEQVILAPNDDQFSAELLQFILKIAEEFVESLELPYRILQIATGDMGAGKVEMYDIECYMPSREAYGETHSASNLGDWQARRLNLRYKDGDETKYCHTLNNTLVASPRILIPLLEVHQNPDGTVTIPQALRPYMQNMAELRP